MSVRQRIDARSESEQAVIGGVALLVGAASILSLMSVSAWGTATPVLALAGVVLLAAGTVTLGTSVSGRNA